MIFPTWSDLPHAEFSLQHTWVGRTLEAARPLLTLAGPQAITRLPELEHQLALHPGRAAGYHSLT